MARSLVERPAFREAPAAEGLSSDLALIGGRANPRLSRIVAEYLGVTLTGAAAQRFPDTELHVQILESVRGKDVFIVQPTSPPVDDNLMELLFLADACRRAGAARTTAVVPYFGYARQDRRAQGREPVAARLVADLMEASGIDALVAVDLHSATIAGFFDLPVVHLSAVPLLSQTLKASVATGSVIVAPDLGAVKLAERYGEALGLPTAAVHKVRLGPEEVKATGIAGDVRGLKPVIVDDMISTGATVVAAAEALLEAGCQPEIVVAATHLLLVGPAIERLAALPIVKLVGSDSVQLGADLPARLESMSLGPALGAAIGRLHRGEPLAGLEWFG